MAGDGWQGQANAKRQARDRPAKFSALTFPPRGPSWSGILRAAPSLPAPQPAGLPSVARCGTLRPGLPPDPGSAAFFPRSLRARARDRGRGLAPACSQPRSHPAPRRPSRAKPVTHLRRASSALVPRTHAHTRPEMAAAAADSDSWGEGELRGQGPGSRWPRAEAGTNAARSLPQTRTRSPWKTRCGRWGAAAAPPAGTAGKARTRTRTSRWVRAGTGGLRAQGRCPGLWAGGPGASVGPAALFSARWPHGPETGGLAFRTCHGRAAAVRAPAFGAGPRPSLVALRQLAAAVTAAAGPAHVQTSRSAAARRDETGKSGLGPQAYAMWEVLRAPLSFRAQVSRGHL